MLATTSRVLSPEVELLLPLPAGTIVRTWDGAIGIVDTCSLSECNVKFIYKTVGQGPWTYERWQVEPATAAEASAHAQAVMHGMVSLRSAVTHNFNQEIK